MLEEGDKVGNDVGFALVGCDEVWCVGEVVGKRVGVEVGNGVVGCVVEVGKLVVGAAVVTRMLPPMLG